MKYFYIVSTFLMSMHIFSSCNSTARKRAPKGSIIEQNKQPDQLVEQDSNEVKSIPIGIPATQEKFDELKEKAKSLQDSLEKKEPDPTRKNRP